VLGNRCYWFARLLRYGRTAEEEQCGRQSKLETVELMVWLLRVSDSILISFSKISDRRKELISFHHRFIRTLGSYCLRSTFAS